MPDTPGDTLPEVARLFELAGVQAVESKAVVDHSDGIMIALMVPDTTAARMTVPDGLPAEELHITLAYLGEVSAVDDDSDYLLKLLGMLRDVAGQHKPFTGLVSGIGRFTGDGQNPDAFYLSFDAPDLAGLHADVCEALEETGIEHSKDHGFTPHITVTYLDKGEPAPLERLPVMLSLEFDTVTLVYGESVIPVPLTGDEQIEDTPDGGGLREYPTSTSATVNSAEGKAFDEAAHPRAAGGRFGPKNKPAQKKPGLPPDWLERTLAGDPAFVKPKGGGGGKGKKKKGGGKGKAKSAAAGAAETERRAVFDEALQRAGEAETARRDKADDAIAAETDPEKKKKLRDAERVQRRTYQRERTRVTNAERSRRRQVAVAKKREAATTATAAERKAG